MPLEIRPLLPSDRDAWTELWRAYLAFYETELAPENYEAQWQRLMSEGSFTGLLACHDGRPVGLAHYIFHDHGWTLAPVCYLQDLYAAPDVRGTGIGRALIEAVYVAADAAGASNTYWNTQEANATARRLYDRIGRLTPFIKYVRG